MAEFKRRFFEGFSLQNFVIKTLAWYSILVGIVVTWKDAEPAIGAIQAYAYKHHLFLVGYLPWAAGLFLLELGKLKLRHDLAYLQWQRRNTRPRRRRDG